MVAIILFISGFGNSGEISASNPVAAGAPPHVGRGTGSFDRLKTRHTNNLPEQPIQVLRVATHSPRPRPPPARLGPRVAAFQALVEVAHHGCHQPLALAV